MAVPEGRVLFISPRLVARAPSVSDLDDILIWFNDPEIGRYMDDPELSHTREDLVDKLFLNAIDLDLVIFEKEGGRRIGFACVYNKDHHNRTCEITLLIGPKDARQLGYAPEILKMLIEAAFQDPGMDTVQAVVNKENAAAMNAFRRSSFTESAIKDNNQDVLFQFNRDLFKKDCSWRGAS